MPVERPPTSVAVVVQRRIIDQSFEYTQLTPPPPPNPTETDPRAPGVTRGPGDPNGIFGIRASRGFRKVIICHVFGENW